MPEQPVSPRAVYTARPTVMVDEQYYPKVNELLLSLEMIEREGGLSALELRVQNVASDTQGDSEFAFEEDDILTLGGRIKIYAGDESSPTEIFRGVITGIEAVFDEDSPPELIVLAEDLLQQARMERRSETHENVSIADLAEALASRLGLTPVITGFASQIGVQVQFNESDLAFLRRLLLVYDGDMQIVGNELHVSPRSEVQRGRVTLAMHSQLRSARILADLAHQVSSVTVSGWDEANGSRIQVRGQGIHSGPGRGSTGQNIIGRAIGTRNHHVHHMTAVNTEEAQSLADTIYDERARRFVVFSGVTDGNPDIRIGTHVEVTDVGRFDNTYYVTYARHFYATGEDSAGYITEFEGQCSYWGQLMMQLVNRFDNPQAGILNGSYLGEVVSVEDPESLSRVQVRLFSCDGLTDHDAPIWARVATPLAGANYGAFIIPNVGDEVLVTFVQGNSRRPVVVGSLWNGGTERPETLTGSRVDRWSITGIAGTRLAIIEAESPTVQIETPGGASATITDDGGGNIEITAAGNTITISPDAITIDGTKVKVNAGQVEVDAGLVKVNAGFSQFSGVVQCDTLITNAVVSSSYTPGAGNVW